MKSFKHVLLLLAVFSFLVLTFSGFAQPAPSPVPVIPVSPAVSPTVTDTMPPLVALITPIFSLGLTWLVKKMAPHIPGVFIPLLAAIFGLLPDLISHYTTGSGTNPILALFLGLTATGLHQISTQLKADPVIVPGSP